MSVGVGLIGCGKRLRDILKRLLREQEGLELVAVTDPDCRCIEETRKLIPGIKTYADHKQLLEDARVDWVMIGSWNYLHLEHVTDAFEAGKNVFCEKPLALSIDECLAMRDAWKKSGKTFSLGLTLRYSPHYRAIHNAVAQNRVGDLVSMEFNETIGPGHGGFIHADWRRKSELSGSHMLEKCCHDIDLANWIVNSLPVRVASFGGLSLFRPEYAHYFDAYGVDERGRTPFHTMRKQTWTEAKSTPFNDDKDIVDHQVAILEYANGVKAAFHTNCCAPIRERRMYILGMEGSIRGDVISGELELLRVGFDQEKDNLGTGAYGGHGGGDDYLAKTLAASMVKGEPPAAGLEDGIRSAVPVYAIDDALETGSVVDVRPYWQKAGIQVSGS
jgi:predicted dehydrogenase